MIEKDIMSLLNSLVDGRVYYDVAPQGAPKPYITLQQVGGSNVAFLAGASNNDQVRIQIDVFSGARLEANDIMTKARERICAEPLYGAPVGAPLSVYEHAVHTYRRSCDFTFLTKM